MCGRASERSLAFVESHVSDQAGVRWAGALQDGTMQGLAALRMLLASGINRGSPEALEHAAEEALRQIDDELGDLRALVSEMKRHNQPGPAPGA
jgi:signal transduction histidine kinase